MSWASVTAAIAATAAMAYAVLSQANSDESLLLGNNHHSWTYHTAIEQEALLHGLQHMVIWHLGRRHHRDGLMEVWIKWLTSRINKLHAKTT